MQWGLVIAALGVLGCRSAPSEAELDRLRDEANRANAEAVARAPASREPGYTLTVSGQIRKPSATLGWSELLRIGQTHVRTINVQNADRKTPTEFRGVLVRDLLDRFDAAPGATEATMVAIDGFRATVQIADARAYRMLLAIEADGAPIPRTAGGPIFLVHPFSESGPELRAKYPDRFWAFYVTHVVVGTEPPRLVIDGHTLDRAALERIPTRGYDGPVGWKVDWPADGVHLRGVMLTDAVAAAGVALPARGRIVIRGKAPIHNDPDQPIAIAVEDVARCAPLLALRSGPDEAPIPARLGGPIALAIGPCDAPGADRLWVTFVEQIAVEAR
ncbi:MAG TPA: molybdopterin-dependent oxidoreductase [Kofleriaceae bacterium]|nr:molybdopterin-dependent oxidoreductase [Kofleriaceae bacterium]